MKPGPAGAGLAMVAGLWLSGAVQAIGPGEAPLIDAGASAAGIEVDLRMGGRVRGVFHAMEGHIERLGDDRLQVSVRLDARSLELDGPEWMERSMRSSKFLNVDDHPWIHFRSEPFPPALVKDGGAMAGSVELRGVARPVAFRVDPSACDTPGHGCDIEVSGQVSRRDFGMTAYRVWLRDEVGFHFHVRLRQP
ncbi:YceI family protein [Arenimonas sp.]|uniref:YceI family protein n=1 Tax=Arenimonas sp. TaxID=1872635 RepID=UPI0035B454F2